MVILGIAVYFAVLLILAVPVGRYLHDVFEGGVRWLQPVERLLLRIAGPAADGEQDWRGYFRAMLMISVIGTVLTYLALRWQGQSPDLAFNTANSFVTNTNWQAYSGETLSYFAQIVLMIQQFISPAIGMAFAIAFIRALVAQRQTLGNFYRDLVRALIYVFLPLTVVGAVLLVALGVPETFGPAVLAHTLGGALQLIDRGPVAAFEAIKMIGTNGGGFFNANSAHPFENPSGLSDILEILMMSILPTALVFTFGRYAKSRRQAWVIAGVTLLLYAAGIATVYGAEAAGNPLLHIVGANWVGKEVRFGIGDSALFSTATTAYTTGAVNNFHDSLTPLGGLVPMLFMFLNLVFGGKGSGLVNILMMVVITVFIAGLMVGRTPEFLGKKIEAKEIRLAVVAMLMHPLLILAPTAFALVHAVGTSAILNSGFHGISEVIYAYASAAANNGSAFAGLGGNTPFYNITLGVVIVLGRYLSVAAMLAMAGSLASKRIVPASAGTLATDSWTFAFVYLGVVMIVAALTFFPALALGPIAEQLAMVVH